jgi:hypothetical protein
MSLRAFFLKELEWDFIFTDQRKQANSPYFKESGLAVEILGNRVRSLEGWTSPNIDSSLNEA